MGRVYEAEQESVDRRVAVKIMRPEPAEDDAIVERFMREAKLVSSFTHPNIVRTIDFGRDPDLDLLYLVMELIEGVPVSRLIDRGPLRVDFVLEVAHQICGGLAEAHSKSVVHRDLKPDNVLVVAVVDHSLQVKLLDFGIAFDREASSDLTRTGSVCGTAHYMAPEQARDREATARTDLYALGVVLYEMLAGERPFDGDTPLSVMYKHVDEPPPPLADKMTAETAVEGSLHELVHDLLAKKPEERPDGALEVRDRIDRIREDTEIGSPRISRADAEFDADEFLRSGSSQSSDTTSSDEETVSPLETTALGFPPDGRRIEPSEPDPSPPRDPVADSGDRPKRYAAAAVVLFVLAAGGTIGWFGVGETSDESSTRRSEGGLEEAESEKPPTDPAEGEPTPAPRPSAARAAAETDDAETAQSVRLGVLYIEGENVDEESDELIEELTFRLSDRPEISWVDRTGILDLFAKKGIEDPRAIERVEAKACEIARQGELDFSLVGDLERANEGWRVRAKLICTDERSVVETFEAKGEDIEAVAESLAPEVVAWAENW